ncbi:hypothetical protein [Streptosporangium sp. G12]
MNAPLESRSLVKALLAMLNTALGATCPVYWAEAPDARPAKYAVMYPDTGMKSAFHRTLTNNGPDELRYQITSVGTDPEQAMWVADKVAYALLTAVPTVAGRRVWPAIEEDSQPIRRDDASTGLFYATAQYLSRSDPL